MLGWNSNEPSTGWEGDGRSPSVTARVLQDAQGGQPQGNQVSYAEYNALGHPTKLTDPPGRETTLTYAPNGIDLTQVRQTTGGLNDVLARS
jgi:uncharacterized protein RhaS with RHS repeats